MTKNEVDAALGSLGKAEPKPISVGSRFRSRFFFRLDEDLLEQRKAAYKPKALVHIDSEIENRLVTYSPEATPKVAANIELVREFFLKEIAPIMLATSSGSRQAYEVVERLIDGKVDTTLMATLDGMVMRAARLKLAQFVTTLFGFDASVVDDLLGPKAQPENGDKKMLTMLEAVVAQLENQSQVLNTLTNEQQQKRQRKVGQ